MSLSYLIKGTKTMTMTQVRDDPIAEHSRAMASLKLNCACKRTDCHQHSQERNL